MVDCVSFMNLNMILSLVLFSTSLVLPIMHILLAPKRLSIPTIAEMMLKYALFFNVGCLFILGGAGQFLYAREIASCIGWSWSPFQYELAFSELCLGILGLLAPLFYREFWLSTTIAAVVWLMGGTAVHLYYLLAHGNEAVINAQFVIGWNVVIAVWLIGLYVILAKPLTKLFDTLEVWRECTSKQ